MKFFFSEAQLAHSPKQYMVHGRIVERPTRVTCASSRLLVTMLG
jgi:hypothetical protein